MWGLPHVICLEGLGEDTHITLRRVGGGVYFYGKILGSTSSGRGIRKKGIGGTPPEVFYRAIIRFEE